MTANFAPMEVQLKTERLDLSMWEESDTASLGNLLASVAWTYQLSTPYATIS